MRHLWLSTITIASLFSQLAFAFPARFGLAPDNNRELLISTVRSAQEELLINIYEFESTEIADAIMERIAAGVTVEILIEGKPIPQLSTESKQVIARLNRAITRSKNFKHRLFIMNSESGEIKRRFRWNHAKYIIADSRQVLISSENFTDSGHPVRGEVGNRGWETVLENPELAKKLTQIFHQDADPSQEDVIELTNGIPAGQQATAARRSRRSSHTGIYAQKRTALTLPIQSGNVNHVELFTSPDSFSPLVEMIRSASKSIKVEQMSLPVRWRDEDRNIMLNPLIEELVAAARRGVEVQVLLNDDRVFGPSDSVFAKARKSYTEESARLIDEIAYCNRLPIDAKIVDVKKLQINYIHNKGFIIDGKKTLVSSINGTQNSVMNNREVAVLLDSRDASRYYAQAFDFDWSQTGNLPPLPGQETNERCTPSQKQPNWTWADTRNWSTAWLKLDAPHWLPF